MLCFRSLGDGVGNQMPKMWYVCQNQAEEKCCHSLTIHAPFRGKHTYATKNLVTDHTLGTRFFTHTNVLTSLSPPESKVHLSFVIFASWQQVKTSIHALSLLFLTFSLRK